MWGLKYVFMKGRQGWGRTRYLVGGGGYRPDTRCMTNGIGVGYMYSKNLCQGCPSF